MKPIKINEYAEITKGPCAGIKGLVIAADYMRLRITIRTNDMSDIETNWENVEQKE